MNAKKKLGKLMCVKSTNETASGPTKRSPTPRLGLHRGKDQFNG